MENTHYKYADWMPVASPGLAITLHHIAVITCLFSHFGEHYGDCGIHPSPLSSLFLLEWRGREEKRREEKRREEKRREERQEG